VINKNITEEEIFAGAIAAVTSSRRRLKLYFMLGLPGETEDDVLAIADLCLRLQASLRAARGGKVGLTLAISTFVPKPHTPLQWCGTLPVEEVRARQDRLRATLVRTGVEVRPHDARLSMLESLLARADRRAGDVVEAAYREGARFDGWDDLFEEGAWKRALAKWDGDPDLLRGPIPLDARLPWDHLRAGPSRTYLEREYRRAMAARPTSPCLRLDEAGGLSCNGCGLECDLDEHLRQLERTRASAEERATSIRAQPDPVRYRLLFSKGGDQVFVGHLDTMRLLARLFRRAGAPLCYSQGYHPKPRLSFAAPLPLGVAGLAEVADLVLEASVEANLLERLRELAPEGLELTSLRRLEPGERGAAKSLMAADLLIASAQLPSDLSASTTELLARESLLVERRKRGTIEVRPLLLDLTPCEDGELLERLGLSPPAIRARVALGGSGSIRPEELLSMLEVSDKEAEVYRLALLTDPTPTQLL
jgi:radical SAM-linked protein